MTGSSDQQLFQPSGMALACSGRRESDDCTVYVLDSGNERIAKYSRSLQLMGYLRSAAVAGHSATGMCASQCGTRLWIANWKMRSVMEVATDGGGVLRTVSLAFMKEPVDVAVNSRGHLLVADAEQGAVYVIELSSSSSNGIPTIHPPFQIVVPFQPLPTINQSIICNSCISPRSI